MTHKSSYLVDVPVLIIFFARSSTLQQVFKSLQLAKPSKLLLWQDGPRDEKDLPGILECRKIFDKIDWECEVFTNYHESNIGCDPSTFLAQKWAFSIVDKCIILEDDMVPSQSFYHYCKELLDKYEFDERINHICGINFVSDKIECDSDYLFSYYGTGAWASWRRVAQGWDESYSYLDDSRILYNLSKRYPPLYRSAYETALDRRRSGKAYWETILGFDAYLNNRLVIIPRVNMVTNIGVTPEATHGSSLKLMDKRVRNLFYMRADDLQLPLKHPRYVIADYKYLDEMTKINCMGRPLLAFSRRVMYYIKCIYYGEIWKKLKR